MEVNEKSNILISEKPDWVSWDDIHEVLWKAHASNRANGIAMRKPSLPGDEIKKEIGEKGKMFVALVDGQLAGTAAIVPKEGKMWYNNGTYGYLCFASVLPECLGEGIYGSLISERERVAKDMNLQKLFFDTHEDNRRVIGINGKYGFKKVAIKTCADHFNIVMVKWLEGCPYSDFYCKLQFAKSWLMNKLRYRMDKQKGRVKRFGI